MENREYYTPEISDLFVGYKCQRRVIKPNYVEKYLYEWRDYTVDEHYFSVGYEEGQDWNYDEVELRTPCLCKQDIIDLGFSTPPYTQIEGYEYYKFLEDNTEVRIVLNDYEDYSKIKIKYDLDLVFEGICKSKNELKKLMKDYLNIHI